MATTRIAFPSLKILNMSQAGVILADQSDKPLVSVLNWTEDAPDPNTLALARLARTAPQFYLLALRSRQVLAQLVAEKTNETTTLANDLTVAINDVELD